MRWQHALLLTVGTIYGAALVPFLFGPLTECGHCVGLYGKLFILTPGLAPGIFLRLGDMATLAFAAMCTLAMLTGFTAIVRVLPLVWRIGFLAVVGIAMAGSTIAISHFLRS